MADVAFTKSVVIQPQVGVDPVDAFVSDTIALTVSGGATPNNKGDLAVEGYSAFAVEFDHNITGSSSTNIKLEVFASLMGTVFGTVAVATIVFTATGVAHAAFSGPFNKLRLKVTNSDASNADNSVVRLLAKR